MLEIRWHGRGGQGAITVSKILAMGALHCGRFAQAFPEYGPERGGAPVKAFNRLDDDQIVVHSGVYEPDIAVVIDETLLDAEDVTGGLKPNGKLILNTTKPPSEIRDLTQFQGEIITLDAETIAEATGCGFANVPTLGAVAGQIEILTGEAMEGALRQFLGAKLGDEVIDKNLDALRQGAERIETLPADERPSVAVDVAEDGAEADELPPYQELLPGAVVTEANRERRETGGWRNDKPVFDEATCVNCLLCWVHCPEPAIITEGRLMSGFDLRFCKGCGICEAVCPSGAISMIPEGSATS